MFMASNATALTADNSLEAYMRQIKAFPVLTREEEEETAFRMRDNNDSAAKNKLVTSNLRFVVQVANEFRRNDRSLLDLIQEGNLGLLHAVGKFDPARGYRLITYAVWWIRAYIQSHVMRNFSLVKIGTTQAQRKIFFRMSAAQNRLIQEHGEGTLTSEERHAVLADYLGVNTRDVSMMEMRQAARDFSLDATFDGDSQQSPMERLEGTTGEGIDDMVMEKQLRGRLQPILEKALQTLSPRERHIVLERMVNDEPVTLRELGETFGISRERTRQLEARAREKLQAFVVAEFPELDQVFSHVIEGETSEA